MEYTNKILDTHPFVSKKLNTVIMYCKSYSFSHEMFIFMRLQISLTHLNFKKNPYFD